MPSQRIAAMHANEITNVKARYELLYQANLGDQIMYDNQQYNLEDLILNQKEHRQKLFLAVEQTLGPNENCVQVIINPKLKNKARKWIVEVYPHVIFNKPNENKTSIDVE